MDTAIYPEEIKAMLVEIEHHPEVHAMVTMLLRLSYTALGMAGEVGEYANKIKKLMRDSKGFITDEQREALGLELGDTEWYVAANAKELGYSLSEIAEMNRAQLAARRESGTIHGSGDNR